MSNSRDKIIINYDLSYIIKREKHNIPAKSFSFLERGKRQREKNIPAKISLCLRF